MSFLDGLKDGQLTLSRYKKNERTVCALIENLFEESFYLISRIVSGYCHIPPLLALIVPMMVRISHANPIIGSKNIPMATKMRSPATIE
jgi:hypothetical protein